jgi:spore maturation protein CgeB
MLDQAFGTSDFWSYRLRALGHECVDVIANHEALQELWARETNWYTGDRLEAQVAAFDPEVVFLQDVGYVKARQITDWKRAGRLVAAQCSCPWPGDENLRLLDCVFTSFPHYVERFKVLGIPRVEYMPLAFDLRMLIECIEPERDLDICFVGGLGRESHWKYGTDVMEAVAQRFGKRFHWYGYGIENVSQKSALYDCWRGFAWGRQMYSLYSRSKIVITRHGEVAQGFTNNLRVFEATGMGALLFTEESPNLQALFPRGTVVSYSGIDDLCFAIQHYLDHEDEARRIAAAGQRHTLENHTYDKRMKQVSEVLTECLEAKQVSQ